jgi:hypothetical protein
LAVDGVVLLDWFIVTAVIALVVGITHSLYGAGRDRSLKRPHGVPKLVLPSTGYFIQTTTPEVDSMLLYGEEMLRKGRLDEAIRTSFSASEDLLQQAAAKMNVAPGHATLADLGRKLTDAGLVQLEMGELSILDTAIRSLGEPLTIATATRALSAAVYVRTYFSHAPIILPADKKSIGSGSPSVPQA